MKEGKIKTSIVYKCIPCDRQIRRITRTAVGGTPENPEQTEYWKCTSCGRKYKRKISGDKTGEFEDCTKELMGITDKGLRGIAPLSCGSIPKEVLEDWRRRHRKQNI